MATTTPAATLDLTPLLDAPRAGHRPTLCVVARWREELDIENGAIFDTLLADVRSGVRAMQPLWRALSQMGLGAGSSSFERHVRRVCSCPSDPTSGETL